MSFCPAAFSCSGRDLSTFASNRAMADWPSTAPWTRSQSERMEQKRTTAKEEWTERQTWKRQWSEHEAEKPTAEGSGGPAASSSAAASSSSGKRAPSPNKIRPPYWRVKQPKVEVKEEQDAEMQEGAGVASLPPPPKYDPFHPKEDFAHHLNKTQTPTSFLPQRHIMMVLGRPVVVLLCCVCSCDCFRSDGLRER